MMYGSTDHRQFEIHTQPVVYFVLFAMWHPLVYVMLVLPYTFIGLLRLYSFDRWIRQFLKVVVKKSAIRARSKYTRSLINFCSTQSQFNLEWVIINLELNVRTT